MLVGDGDRGVGGERRHACEHLVEDDSERVDIAPAVDAEALRLLGREVGRRSHDEAGLSDVVVSADSPRDAEVGHLHLAVPGEKDVARLDVAVDDAVAMGIAESLRDVGGDGGGPHRRERSLASDDRREGLPVDVLHDDEIRPLRLAPVEDRHDVRVGEVGCRLSLPAEAVHKGAVT